MESLISLAVKGSIMVPEMERESIYGPVLKASFSSGGEFFFGYVLNCFAEVYCISSSVLQWRIEFDYNSVLF